MGTFGRVITAMVTPFDDAGAIDLDAAAQLAVWLVETGSEGLVLAGTTGEAPTLSDSEVLALTRTVRSAVTVPLIVGTGSNSTAHAVELTEHACAAGADAILTVTPYYNRPSPAGIEEHFRSVAEASTRPVILYDIPIRAGRPIGHDVLVRLSEVDNIVGVKDATGNPAEAARLVADTAPEFELYSGNDGDTLPLLAVGAVGVISVASHWLGKQFRAMFDAWESGDLAEARRINAAMIPSFAFEGTLDAPNPVPTKAMLTVLGHSVGRCRAPMGPFPDDIETQARDILQGLQ